MKDESIKEKEYYREKIIEMVRKVEKINVLEYLFTYIKLFIEKWG